MKEEELECEGRDEEAQEGSTLLEGGKTQSSHQFEDGGPKLWPN